MHVCQQELHVSEYKMGRCRHSAAYHSFAVDARYKLVGSSLELQDALFPLLP